MVLKSEIENSYKLQQEFVKMKLAFTDRNYLQSIKFDGTHIEVISGIRRSGKSTLMKLLIDEYGSNVAYFNFEDPRVFNFEVSDFQKLDEVIGEKVRAYFFDEIQNVPSWEVFIRSLHDRGKKVFITGSNASLLSKDLGTRLTGRHLRHELFPFSYREFLAHLKLDNSVENLTQYVQDGGFPEFIKAKNQEILQTLLKDIVLRDIAIRYGIKNSKTVMDIALYLISNIGKECTYNRIRKLFSVGSTNSVVDYLTWLEDAYLLFFLPKFSWSAKSIAVNGRKVYAIDNGLINANSLSFTKDKGRLLENTVFLYLRQQGMKLFYFREKGECDFVVFDKNICVQLIQVCEEVHSENKKREVYGLLEAMQYFGLKEGFIVTKNQNDVLQVENLRIQLICAKDFLLK
jgi:uncharacterized protein